MVFPSNTNCSGMVNRPVIDFLYVFLQSFEIYFVLMFQLAALGIIVVH